MLNWLRRAPVVTPKVLAPPIEVRPQRGIAIFSNLQSSKRARLDGLLAQDGYTTTPVTTDHLKDCVIDTSSGLVVRSDGTLDETCRHVASYYTDTTLPDVAKTVQQSASSAVKDDLVHVFHRSCGAYGHFILDGLCALALLDDIILERGLKVLLPANAPSWMGNVLASIGYDERRLVRVAGVTRCRSLLTSSMLMGGNCFLPNPDIITQLARLVWVRSTQADRNLYLTRENAHSPRYVENEEAVQSVFRDAGFEIVSPAMLPFRDQVALFASAKTIAGSHGSAFANIVFAPPGSRIIDMMPEDWVGYWGDSGGPERWLLNLTAACGHHYGLVLSPSKMTGQPYLPNSSTELAKIDTTVDLEAVKMAIASIRP